MSRNSYGIIHKPNPLAVIPAIEFSASMVITALSGKFVHKDGSNQLAISGSGTTQLAGWLMVAGAFTSNSVAGIEKASVCVDLNAIFEIPTDATFASTDIGALLTDTCDLITTSNVQMADIGESNEDTVKIVSADVDQQTFGVMINPGKFYTQGVA